MQRAAGREMGTDDDEVPRAPVDVGVLSGLPANLVEQIAAAVAAKLGATSTASAIAPKASLTWRELWVLYRDAERENLESWDSVESMWKHLDREIGNIEIAKTDIATVRMYTAVRREQFTVRKTLTTAKTRNNEKILWRRMSRWGKQQKYTAVDPLGDIGRASLFEVVDNVRRNVVEDDPDSTLSIDALLRFADELDTAIVLIAHRSGMRRAEIARLEWDWIDLRPGPDGAPMRIIEIPPGVSKGRRGKKEGRQTFMSAEALEAAKRYRSTLPFPLQRRCPWVLPNPKTGKPYHKDWLTERFRRLQERAGLIGPSGPPWLHDLRRSFITLARRRGEETTNIMAASGHKTLHAFQRYNIHARRDAIRVRDRVEKARAEELAALEERRRGPQRAAESAAPNSSLKKNNPV